MELGRDWDRTGTGLEQNWDGTGTELGRDWDGTMTGLEQNWNGTGTGREPVRDGTKTEPIFVLFYDVPFKVLFQSRPSLIPNSIQLSSEMYCMF